MYGIKLPVNEFFTGRHYVYNKDQDQTRTQIKRLIDATTFVDDTDYDDEGYLTFYAEVRYKQYVDTTSRGGYAVGVRQKIKDKQIEISDSTIVIKEKDRFKLLEQTDDEKGYIVTDVDYNRNSHKAMATLLLPGLENEYNSNTIVSLK